MRLIMLLREFVRRLLGRIHLRQQRINFLSATPKTRQRGFFYFNLPVRVAGVNEHTDNALDYNDLSSIVCNGSDSNGDVYSVCNTDARYARSNLGCDGPIAWVFRPLWLLAWTRPLLAQVMIMRHTARR